MKIQFSSRDCPLKYTFLWSPKHLCRKGLWFTSESLQRCDFSVPKLPEHIQAPCSPKDTYAVQFDISHSAQHLQTWNVGKTLSPPLREALWKQVTNDNEAHTCCNERHCKELLRMWITLLSQHSFMEQKYSLGCCCDLTPDSLFIPTHPQWNQEEN